MIRIYNKTDVESKVNVENRNGLSKDLLPTLCFGVLQLFGENEKTFLLEDTRSIFNILKRNEIRNNKSAKEILDWYLDVGFRYEVDHTKSVRINPVLRCLRPLGLPEDELLSCNSLIGYDIEMLAYLARLSYNARYITRKDCETYYKSCLELARHNFENWNEYFISACIGFYICESEKKSYKMSTQAAVYLELKVSTWKEYPLEKTVIIEELEDNEQYMAKVIIKDQEKVKDILNKVVEKSLDISTSKLIEFNLNIENSDEISIENNIEVKQKDEKSTIKDIDTAKIKEQYHDEFKNYLEVIKPLAKNFEKIGAIVDNFDPFTFEHRILIERAFKEVDFLYLFIKDNEVGLIPVEDRFKLLQLELQDLEKITILTCGGFIF